MPSGMVASAEVSCTWRGADLLQMQRTEQLVTRHIARVVAAIVGLLLGILVASSSAFASSTGPGPRAPWGVSPQRPPHIVGGYPVPMGYGFMAYITYHVPGAPTETVCSGSVVSSNVVLTAGHCVVDTTTGQTENPAWFMVETGSPDLASSAVTSSSVSEAMPYPGFHLATADGDAGLLVLSSPINEPSLRLATSSDGASEQPGRGAIVSGWGLTSPDASEGPSVLQWAGTVVQSSTACTAYSSLNFPFDRLTELCAIDYPALDNSICQGDSGGPLITLDGSGKLVEIGIVSHAPKGCPTDLPNFYTRVSAISTWANEVIRQVAPPPPPPQLPSMSISNARNYVGKVLTIALGRTSKRRTGYSTRCSRQSATRVSCHVGFSSGGNAYYGTVTVYYELVHGTVYWTDIYTIHWVSKQCLGGAHPKRCRVHTKTGS